MTMRFRRNLASRFVSLMVLCTMLFILGSALFVMYQQSLVRSFEAAQQRLEQKEILTRQLDRAFTQAFFDVRAILHLDVRRLKKASFSNKKS